MKPIVIGYHGCDKKVAMAVVTRQVQLVPSKNKYDWLGHGLYYWEDDPERALRWAIERGEAGTHKISDPAVLGAVIDLTNGLNLVHTEAYALVKEAFSALELACKAAGQPLPKNRGFLESLRYLDSAVFETLHALREESNKEPFTSVRAFFPEGEPVFPGAGIRERDHIQICVRNSGCILGHFLPTH